MLAQDKREIVSNLREQGVDITKQLIAPLVIQVEKYAKTKGLEPIDEPVHGSVVTFQQVDKNKFSALLNDGSTVPISQQTYQTEAVYNFLPIRYKTLKL